MSEDNLCPICSRGKLTSLRRKVQHSYKGMSGVVQMYSKICTFCGVDMPDADQIKTNTDVLVRFQNEVDAKLTKVDIYDLNNEIYLNIDFPHRVHTIPVTLDTLEKLDMALFIYFRDKGKDTFRGGSH